MYFSDAFRQLARKAYCNNAATLRQRALCDHQEAARVQHSRLSPVTDLTCYTQMSIVIVICNHQCGKSADRFYLKFNHLSFLITFSMRVFTCALISWLLSGFRDMFCTCKSHILVLWALVGHKLGMLIKLLWFKLNILWRVITVYWILKIWNRGADSERSIHKREQAQAAAIRSGTKFVSRKMRAETGIT